jgi:hypothetical protein
VSFVDRLFPRSRQQAGVPPAPVTMPAAGAPAPSTVYPVASPGSAPSPVMATEWQPAPYGQEAATPVPPAPQAPPAGSAQGPAAPVPPAGGAPSPVQAPAPSPAPARSAPSRQDVEARMQALSRQLAELQWDLGGLTYEMAIRDHFRLDVLARQAARLQAVDAELAEVERQLRLEDAGASGECPSCRALHSRGAVFCWACGTQLLPTQPAGGPPPAPTA